MGHHTTSCYVTTWLGMVVKLVDTWLALAAESPGGVRAIVMKGSLTSLTDRGRWCLSAQGEGLHPYKHIGGMGTFQYQTCRTL